MMYIYGGSGKDNTSFKEIMQFSYINCEWTVLKHNNNPPARDSHVAFGWEDKLYIFGGSVSNKKANDVWEFDIEKKSWREIKPEGTLPVEREAHSTVLIPDNTALIFGGKGSDEKLADAQVLTLFPSSHLPRLCWTKASQLGQVPCSRDGHSMCTVVKDVYLFGGEDEEKLTLNDLYIGIFTQPYVITWKKCEQKNHPQARRASTLSSYLNEYLILFGGEAYGERDTYTLNDIWLYNIATKTWEELNNIIRIGIGDEFLSRAYHSVAVYENCIYIFGGINRADKILDDLWVLSLNGEIPKALENVQPLASSIISGKDGKTFMSSTTKVQYFTQYMQDIPFPIDNKGLDIQSKEGQDDAKKYLMLGVSPKYLLDSTSNNVWLIGSFGDLLNVLEDLTGNNEFRIRVIAPQKRATINLEEDKAIDDNTTLNEYDILTRYAKQMKETLKSQDRARMQPAIEISTEGVNISADNFKDTLYFFGRRINQKNSVDFGLLKESLIRIGNTVLIINKVGGSANIGLISFEYMDLLHTDYFYCPYIKLAMEDGKLTADSSSLTMLDKMIKYSYIPFENRNLFLAFIQGMDDNLVFLVTRISKPLRYKSIDKEDDIVYLTKETEVQDYELLDYSLRIYLRYWNLWNKSRVMLEDTDAGLENPYVVLRRYAEARKINKWIKAINFSINKIDCVGLLFHINLFVLPEMKTFEKHCEIFNGVLIYWQNKLLARILGPKLGDHIELVRKACKKKEKHGHTHKLFNWNGYISIAKGIKDDILNPLFLCKLEETLFNMMQLIKKDSSTHML